MKSGVLPLTSSTGPCNLGRSSAVGNGDPLFLYAGIEHADRLDARIGAQRDREKSSAGLPHDRDFVHGDLAFQRRAASCVFFAGPVDRGAQVIGGRLPPRSAFLGKRAQHQKAVRSDGG